MRVWPLWERLSRRIWRTVPIPNAPHGALDVYFGRYHGEPIVLSDGTPIQPGDRVIELHTNNLIVLDAVQGSRWHILRVLEGDLRALAAWVSQPDFSPDVQAIYAVTVLGRGATWLGFHLRDRPPGLRARLDRLFMAGLLAIYTNEGFDRLSRGKTFGPYPQEMWMSRAELLRRYGESTT